MYSCVNSCCTAKWLSYMHIYILFNILFHYDLSQDTEYSSLCYIIWHCCLSILFFSFLPPCGIWSSWGREQIWATVESCAAAVVIEDPLTYCVGLGIRPVSWHCRDATKPTVPQWELLFINSICNNLHLLTPNSHSIRPPTPCLLGNHISVLYVIGSVFVLQMGSLAPCFRFHI